MKKRLLIACLVLLSAVSTTHAYVEVKDNLIVPLDDRAVREVIFKAQLAKVNQPVIDAYHLLPDAELGIVPNAPHPVLTTDFDQAWPMIEKFLAK